jgi:hypothetical protein
MAENVVIETVFREEIRFQVTVVEPIIRQLLQAEDEDGPVAQFVVLDDGEGGEGLAEADAVGEDAAAVGFELVDDPGGGIPLEIVAFLAIIYLRNTRCRTTLIVAP